MTRKSNKNSRRGARRSSRSISITRVPFHHVVSAALSSGSANVAIRPSSGNLGAASAMYTAFDLYRLRKLRFRLLPNTSMGTAQVAGFYPEAVVTNPTIANGSDCIDSCYVNNDMTVPSRWVNVPAVRIKGQVDWYKSQPDAGDIDLEDAGNICVSGTTTETYYLEVEGLWEFKNPNNPAITLERIKDQVRAEMKETLLSSKITKH
jgi:hypothetical protein